MSFLSQLNWRFATKKFNIQKPVAKEDLEKIMEAIRLAPTSLGLQPFHVYVVQSNEIRQKLLPLSFNQAQVTDSSYLLVFCVRLDMLQLVDSYIEVASNGDEASKAKLEQFRLTRKERFAKQTPEQIFNWAARSVYIALGFGLAACAELGIDSCPMEGFESAKVDMALGLPPHLKSVCYLAIGYRLEEPQRPKVRFSKDELFTLI